ncbi:MAG: DUF805 domain-containing protein [Plesiomonas sp.]|uniref:DUF805 domain-containing protein n=1 Tax=Plesiomonas sp. TaxID=2486279 RepID=UPI003EE47A6A
MYWIWLMLSFRGRISRMQFGLGLGFLAALILISQGLLGLISIVSGAFSFHLVWIFNALLGIYALLALMAKRLSDARLSKTLLWVNLLPAAGTVLLFGVLFLCATVAPVNEEHVPLETSSLSH